MRLIFLLLLFFSAHLLPAQQNALVVLLPFAVSERIPRGAVARLQLQSQDGQELLSLEVRRAALELFGPGRVSLLECPVAIGSGSHQLQLRAVSDKTELVLDGLLLGRAAPVLLPPRPQVLFQPASRITAQGRPRVQKLAVIDFSDDFARDGASDLQWEVLQGTFALNLSRHPGSSQGAFQLWGACPEGTALALAQRSHWFWQDYRCGATLLPDATMTAWGLVFCGWSEQDYHLFRLVREGEGERAEFLRVRQGVETVLARQPLPAAAESWRRLEVFCRDGRLRGMVGGREVLQCLDPAAAGGRIGLYGRQAKQFFVDDVSASSLSQEEFEAGALAAPFGPCEQLWNDFADKHFAADRHMSSWAHPRSFWAADGQGMFWFRNRFFGDVEFQWHGSSWAASGEKWRLCLFSAGRDPDSGYSFAWRDGQLILSRQGREVARAQQSAPAGPELTIRAKAAGGTISFWRDDQLLLSWEDPEFLNKGETGVAFARPLPRFLDQAKVLSSQRLDYSFEHAPAAWAVQAGTWQGLHRWACVPKWSFFGGRGSAGPQGVRHANAVLWNLRRCTGDFDLEIFAAPLEGTPQRAHFSWPVSINVAFAADGQSLESGYNFLFGTYDVPSQLFWQGREIAATDAMLDLTLRQQPTAWYHRMTQAWQHLRIQRRDGRILIDAARHDDQARHLGLQRLFDLPAAENSDAGQFAVWTYGDNGLSIARATLAFEDSDGAAPPPPRRPELQSCSGDGVQAPEQYFRAVNDASGGLFTRQLSHAAVDLSVTGELRLAWRSSADARLSLFALLRGQCAELVLTGPAERRPGTIFLGPGETRPASWPGWQITTVNLAAVLSRYFPSGPLQVESLWLGSPYQTYAEIAGFGVNPVAAWYEYQPPQWLAGNPLPPAPPRGLILHCHGRNFYNDFEEDFGDWQRLGGQDGAALLLDDPQPDDASGRSLRLLNQRLGGAAGAWITRREFSLSDFPGLCFRYRLPAGIEHNLLVIVAGRWREVQLSSSDASWPLLGPAVPVRQDERWQQLEINLAERLSPNSAGNRSVEALALADSAILGSRQRAAAWVDEFQLIPALAPGEEVRVSDARGRPVQAVRAQWSDSPLPDIQEETPLPGNIVRLPAAAPGGWLHLQAQFADASWSRPRAVRYLRRETPPPPPPPASAALELPPLLPPLLTYLPSDRLLLTDFEAADPEREEVSRSGEFTTRREAWALLDQGQAAGGEACGVMVNLSESGFFSAYLRQSAWDVRRWPCVSFDYRFAIPGCALNLSLLVNDAMSIVEWTGPNRPGNNFDLATIGAADLAQQDGSWHNCAFDLAAMLLSQRFAGAREQSLMTASELSFWATNHQGRGYYNPLEAKLYIDNILLYSERGRDPAFRWQQPPGSRPAVAYAYLFNQEEDSVPPEEINFREPAITFPGTAPGVWYFHLRAVAANQQWSPTTHRKITIRE